MRMPTADLILTIERRSDVRLRRAPTPAQLRILDLMSEAPSYATLAQQLGVETRTVRQHVAALAGLLPPEFAPQSAPKERVIMYAVRLYAERSQAQV